MENENQNLAIGKKDPREIEQEKRRVREVIREQDARLAIAEMIHQISETCFKKCVEQPGLKLTNAERNCITYCGTRFLGM